MSLRMIDTFSGIGGFSLAARWLGGIETVQFVEREPFCHRILSKHWPTVPIHDDICTFQPKPGSADIICGGFPCQDISQAGKGAGLAGSRSGLFYELLRVVRLVGPQYIVLENNAAHAGPGGGRGGSITPTVPANEHLSPQVTSFSPIPFSMVSALSVLCQDFQICA